jgi:nitroreductase
MDLLKIIKERKSTWAFKTDPVPREKIEEILRISIIAPSVINLQPWEFVVVSGEEKERLSRRLIKAYREKQISCSSDAVKPLPKTYSKKGAQTLRFFWDTGYPWPQTTSSFSNRLECSIVIG